MTTGFAARLAAVNPPARGGRRTVFAAYDQLSDAIGPLGKMAPEDTTLLLLESPARAGVRPVHQQKIAFVIGSMRAFALEQAARGVHVDHRVIEGSYADALRERLPTTGPIHVMTPAERCLREELRPLVEDGSVVLAPHDGFLTTRADFQNSVADPPWRMDSFYRFVRRQTGILMDGDKPRGGRFSFDGENRKPWKGVPKAPRFPRFVHDEMRQELVALIRSRFAHHPGTLDVDSLPLHQHEVEQMWSFVRDECLENFGPYEDAMSQHARTLFHTRIAMLLNTHRLLPARVLRDVVDAAIPLPSQEGFVRQILGWREFVRHVHEATDGFRQLPHETVLDDDGPGDAGFGRYRGAVWAGRDVTPGAAPQFLDARTPLPPAFWEGKSGLACLDRVVEAVWDEGYSHHITRLMVLANIAQLLDVNPRELTDWFWCAYTDAYDWVVEPNVLGMGTFAAGDVMTTKPYVAGAAYIAKMSDFCRGCAFDPKKTCPLTSLYWAYLERHRARLATNQRLKLPMASSARRPASAQSRDARVFAKTCERLAAGETLCPDDFANL